MSTSFIPHSPAPWRKGATHCNPRARSFTTSIFAGEDLIAETTTFFDARRSKLYPAYTADEARLVSKGNAEKAVLAFNTHDQLVEALERLLKSIGTDPYSRHAQDTARAVIARAKGDA